MEYEELAKKTRQGDRVAAQELTPLARARHDRATLLFCWRVLSSHRFNAWSALASSLDASGWRSDVTTSGVVRTIDHFTTTDSIRAEVVARALVEACRTIDRNESPVAGALADLATRVLEAGRLKTKSGVYMEVQEFLSTVDNLPFEENAQAMLAVLSRAQRQFDQIQRTLRAAP